MKTFINNNNPFKHNFWQEIKIKSLKIPFKLVFIITGIISTIWFLIRVIPKPSRAGYPCMRAAAPIMSSFILYLIGISASFLAFKKAKHFFIHAKYFIGGILFIAGLITGIIALISNRNNAMAQSIKSFDQVANNPVGEGKGIFPGRVVWVWDADATNENCLGQEGDGSNTVSENDDYYFLNKNNDQTVINQMMSDAIAALAGIDSLELAWDTIFKHFNHQKGKGYVGYDNTEIVFIKTNATSAWGDPSSTGMYTSDLTRNVAYNNDHLYDVLETTPQVVMAVLNQLINKAGVPQNKIYVGDPMKNVYKHCADLWWSEFPDINILGNNIYYSGITNLSTLGRTPVQVTANDKIFYSDDGTVMTSANYDKLYTIFEDADYMINIPVLKGHDLAGITLGAKNHFGSHSRKSANHLHSGLIDPDDTQSGDERYDFGLYRVQVDIMGHELLGRNTILHIVDALYSAEEDTEFESSDPEKWNMAPFNGDWTSSIFISQDQVAIESVCYDFLRSEYNQAGHNPQQDAVDDYLHQAADSSCWPSGITYDPENDGTPIASLGVHEHWNNSTDKEYSRNLGTADGIELIKVHKLTDDTTNTDTLTYHQNKPDNKMQAISIYPVPADDYIKIKMCNDIYGEFQIDLIGVSGKLFKSQTIQKNSICFEETINLEDYNNKILIIKLKNKNYYHTKKVIMMD